MIVVTFAVKFEAMKSKKAGETLVSTAVIVLPNHANTLGNLFGGQLLAWMDNTAAICAMRHSQRVVVTASVNNVSFTYPIKIGDVVTLEAKVSRAFTSAMEVFIDVIVESGGTGKMIRANEAIFTFVAVDQNGNPIEIPKVVPESIEEKNRFDGAMRRRQLSLILGGKLDPSEATDLKALFMGKEKI